MATLAEGPLCKPHKPRLRLFFLLADRSAGRRSFSDRLCFQDPVKQPGAGQRQRMRHNGAFRPPCTDTGDSLPDLINKPVFCLRILKMDRISAVARLETGL